MPAVDVFVAPAVVAIASGRVVHVLEYANGCWSGRRILCNVQRPSFGPTHDAAQEIYLPGQPADALHHECMAILQGHTFCFMPDLNPLDFASCLLCCCLEVIRSYRQQLIAYVHACLPGLHAHLDSNVPCHGAQMTLR